MTVDLLAQWETLNTKLKSRCCIAAFPLCCFLLILFCPLILKITLYFFPLFVSTAVCSTAVYLFISSEKKAARDILLVEGERGGRVVVQIYEEANFSIYSDHVEVGCFLLMSKSDVDEIKLEYCEEIMLVGKVEVGSGKGVVAEHVASFEIDSMAEVKWNRFFGMYSKWY